MLVSFPRQSAHSEIGFSLTGLQFQWLATITYIPKTLYNFSLRVSLPSQNVAVAGEGRAEEALLLTARGAHALCSEFRSTTYL